MATGGRVWASLLVGEPGFVRVLDERAVRIAATLLPGDPLEEDLQGTGTEVGVLAIDLAARRRCARAVRQRGAPTHLRVHPSYLC